MNKTIYIALALLLSACGGGGTSGNGATTTAAAETTAPIALGETGKERWLGESAQRG
ncbi:hypothetical protein BH10PSE15_BH10PSE15_04760 [soil metagenome]